MICSPVQLTVATSEPSQEEKRSTELPGVCTWEFTGAGAAGNTTGAETAAGTTEILKENTLRPKIRINEKKLLE